MARIDLHREVGTRLPLADAQRQLKAVFTAREATMVREGEGYLEGRTGSQTAVRLKGGWLAKLADFPVVAAAILVPSPTGTTVRLTVADDLGFGLRTGIKGKFEKALTAFADDLATSITGQTSASVAEGSPTERSPAQYCVPAKLAPTNSQHMASHPSAAKVAQPGETPHLANPNGGKEPGTAGPAPSRTIPPPRSSQSENTGDTGQLAYPNPSKARQSPKVWLIIGAVITILLALSMYLDYRSGLGDKSGGYYDPSLECVRAVGEEC